MKYGSVSDNPADYCTETEDQPVPVVSAITWVKYEPYGFNSQCVSGTTSGQSLNSKNKFGIKVTINNGFEDEYNSEYIYNLSLNPQDGDYIYKVLSSSPETGNTPLYVEAVYESSLEACGGLNIASGASAITELCGNRGRDIDDDSDVTDDNSGNTFSDVDNGNGRPNGDDTQLLGSTKAGETVMYGQAYYLQQIVGGSPCDYVVSGTSRYTGSVSIDSFEHTIIREAGSLLHIDNPQIVHLDVDDETEYQTIIKQLNVGEKLNISKLGVEDCYDKGEILFVRYVEIYVPSVGCDYDDYLDAYRPAQTPWFVSEAYASTSGSGRPAAKGGRNNRIQGSFRERTGGKTCGKPASCRLRKVYPDEDGCFRKDGSIRRAACL